LSHQNVTPPRVDAGSGEEEKELWIKHGGGEAGQEEGLGSSRNRRDPPPFAPCPGSSEKERCPEESTGEVSPDS